MWYNAPLYLNGTDSFSKPFLVSTCGFLAFAHCYIWSPDFRVVVNVFFFTLLSQVDLDYLHTTVNSRTMVLAINLCKNRAITLSFKPGFLFCTLFWNAWLAIEVSVDSSPYYTQTVDLQLFYIQICLSYYPVVVVQFQYVFLGNLAVGDKKMWKT